MSEGILLIDKPKGKTSFSLISLLRKILNVKTIGHAGTLDPMATGVMVLLIGKKYTTLSNTFLNSDKEYIAEITLGASTDSYDAEGVIDKTSDIVPTIDDVEREIKKFQGIIHQTPPMYSAKKVDGKRLYELAREGKEIERKAVPVEVHTSLINYTYPKIAIEVSCSKGTYVRSIAHELGENLKCHGHLSSLIRTKSGTFRLKEAVSGEYLFKAPLQEAKEAVVKALIKNS